ncbi:uracil-DNA glycosylase [Rhodoferax sp. U11-2br]|uniref:uracil-DNA glycosylase n=1 Tax=Rhodoferax sp. U11-2br TaxID=2838878 RepID=UPI001BE81B0B|nr:uracil-DNA glycosylase [Rhodoferax sp. U11-2br]MBT3066970.1 uracil-DNA glycosylase [Rhodoferax sp. U11-2br]
MSLDLDTRQRAMLAEMGVHVWWPDNTAPDEVLAQAAAADLQADSDRHHDLENAAPSPDSERAGGQIHPQAAAPQPSSARSAPPAATAPPAAPEHPANQRPTPPARARQAPSGPAPTALTPLPPGIETMDWPTLQATVVACQACAMCLGRRGPVLAAPPDSLRADWLVLGEPPDDAQERAGEPFVDDAGLLLDNMLKAVGVQRHQTGLAEENNPAQTAYLSLVLKCRPVVPTTPDTQALADCAHYLRREIALVQPKVILAMGRLAMQVLLSQDHPQGLKLPLGKLRGQVWHYQGVPVVVTYPPAYLLRNPLDKARAWEDLCLAAEVAQAPSR